MLKADILNGYVVTIEEIAEIPSITNDICPSITRASGQHMISLRGSNYDTVK